MTKITTSWMWPTPNGGVNGLNIDREKGVLLWFDDAIACACGDSTAEQSYADFKDEGPVFGTMPDDVLAEVRESLAALET